MAAKRGISTKSRVKAKNNTRVTAKQRKQRRKNARRGVLFTAVVCVLASFIYILNLSQLRIDSVVVDGVVSLEAQTLELQVSSDLSGKKWGLFPRDSIFWYGKKKVRQTLLETYPELKSLEVDLQKMDVLYISVVERETQYHANIDGVLHNVDSSGVLFQVAEVNTEPERVFYSRLASSSQVLGDAFIDPEYFVTFNQFLDDLSQRGIVVSKILFENKIQTILELENKSRIVIHPSDNFDVTLSTLQEILPYKEFGFERKTGLFGQDVAYINFRYGKKLFYCYQTDECADNYQVK